MDSLNLSKLTLSSRKNREGNYDNIYVDLSDPYYVITDPDADYVCEYWSDIWRTLIEEDAKTPKIRFRSPELEFRGTLVRQILDLVSKLNLSIHTCHTSIMLLDLFMDAHEMRTDRLVHVALACISLAGKSEETYSLAPNLKSLSKASGIELCGKTFRQLEWMIAQHVKWRLLMPTIAHFATTLVRYLVVDDDITIKHPKFVWKFKRDILGRLLEHVDATVYNVRLRALETVDVACACVACARAAVGLESWPLRLAVVTGRKVADVAPVARLLQKMMQVLKSRDDKAENETDKGYNSSSCTSPQRVSHTASSWNSCFRVNNTHRHISIPNRKEVTYSVLDLDSSSRIPNVQDYCRLPAAVDLTCRRVDSANDYEYYKSRRLLEASLGAVPSASAAVKHGLETAMEVETKRHRLNTQLTQVVV